MSEVNKTFKMSIPIGLEPLVSLDKLRRISGAGKPTFIHNDHRWVLPILAWAQLTGALRAPCLLIMFDYHTDSAEPFLIQNDEGRELVARFNSRPDIETAMEICRNHLDETDGDWVSGGMELGIIGDAVVFGAELGHAVDERDGALYTDMLGRTHTFWPLPLPYVGLAHQGPLADHYHKPPGLWEALGWSPSRGIQGRQNSIALDFDLDVFACHTNLGPIFPWPEKIFVHQLREESIASSVEGMTGYEFVRKLIERASVITIAREPDYCGGEQDCDEILRLVDRHIFDGCIASSAP